MSKYHKFGDFMEEVLTSANNRVDLKKLFVLENLNIVDTIRIIIRKLGWSGFLVIVALLLLGPILFGTTIGTFLASPPGLVFLAIFGVLAIPKLKELYKNRVLPIAIKEVGEQFQPRWKRVEGDYEKIDALEEEAVNALIQKATLEQRKLLGLDD